MRKPAARRRRIAAGTLKGQMLAAIETLPADATIEDAIERLVFLAKITRGLAQVDGGEGIGHEEAKRRLTR
jgi:predicted transcriptional regulator